MKKIITLFLLMTFSVFANTADDYREDALNGDAWAQYNLGVCYDNGTGVLEDDKQAVYWYTKSAEQGNAKAQSNLGNRYYYGEGVRKDEIMAYACYLHAKLNGEEDIDFETLNLTQVQKEEGQQLAKTLFK